MSFFLRILLFIFAKQCDWFPSEGESNSTGKVFSLLGLNRDDTYDSEMIAKAGLTWQIKVVQAYTKHLSRKSTTFVHGSCLVLHMNMTRVEQFLVNK